MDVCSDPNWTAQLLQMAVSKSLKAMSGIILNLYMTGQALTSFFSRSLNSHFFLFWGCDLLNEPSAKTRATKKTFQHQSMSNAIIYVDQF